MAAGQLNTFLDRLFQHIPAEKQAEARSTYSTLQDRLKSVDDTAQQQADWWGRNKDAVADRDRLTAELTELKAKPVVPVVSGGMDQNAIDRAIQESTARTLETALGLGTALVDISSSHYKEFGEPINTRKLASEAIAANMPIDQFYAQSVADRRATRAQENLTAQLAAAREEGIGAGRKEVMDSMGKSLPFPSPSGANAITTLSGLRKPADGTVSPFSLDAAVATAMEVAAGQNK